MHDASKSNSSHTFMPEIKKFCITASFFFILAIIVGVLKNSGNEEAHLLNHAIAAHFVSPYKEVELVLIYVLIFLYCISFIASPFFPGISKNEYIKLFAEGIFHATSAAFGVFAAFFVFFIFNSGLNFWNLLLFLGYELYIAVIAVQVSFANYLADEGAVELARQIDNAAAGDSKDKYYFAIVYGLGGATTGLLTVFCWRHIF